MALRTADGRRALQALNGDGFSDNKRKPEAVVGMQSHRFSAATIGT
jgi:hypothetical protein